MAGETEAGDPKPDPKFKIGDRIVDVRDNNVPRKVYVVVDVHEFDIPYSNTPFRYDYGVECEDGPPEEKRHPDGCPWILLEKYSLPAPPKGT